MSEDDSTHYIARCAELAIENKDLRDALAALVGKADAYRTMSLQNVIPTVTAHQFVVAISRAKELLKEGGGDA